MKNHSLLSVKTSIFVVNVTLLLLVPSAVSGQSLVVIEGYIHQVGTGIGIEGDVTLIEGMTNRKLTNYRTDSRGYYRLEAAAAIQKTLVAKAHGYVSLTRVLPPSTQTTLQVNFPLVSAISVSGFVVDSAGVPIDGATVRVIYPDEPLIFRFKHETGEAQTNISGGFRLPFVKGQGRFAVEATKPGYRPGFTAIHTSQGVPIEDVQVQMRRGATINALVEDRDGQPISGGVLNMKVLSALLPPELARASIAAVAGGNRTLVTTSNGRLTFSGLPVGAVVIVARHQAYIPKRINASVVSEDQTSEIRIVLDRR